MSHTSYTVGWYSMTIIIPLCCITCLILLFLQILSIKRYQTQSENTSKELFLLFGIFLTGLLCSTDCFMLHLSNLLADWYCIYGIGICTVFYFAEKSFLYGFFLERSRSVQILLDQQILPNIIMQYIFPLYIAIYFSIFSILALTTYRGRVVSPLDINGKHNHVTSCIFWQYYHWMWTIGAFCDGITCSLLLFLFIYPLYSSMKSNKPSKSTQSYKRLSKIMKINTICSAVCMLSSITTMSIMAASSIDYVWVLGNIDMLINSIFAFMIPDMNRQYIQCIMSYCCNKENDDDTNKSQSTILGSVTTKKRQSLSTIYERETKDYNTTTNIQLAKAAQLTAQAPVNINILDLAKYYTQANSRSDGNTSSENTVPVL
eukprot:421163_1